jgi:hypothetical protein
MDRSEVARPIRICLAILPDVARDLLRETFAAHDDIEVVDLRGEAAPPAGGCDVLVTSAGGSRAAAIALPALARRPMCLALVVTIDGAQVMIFEFRPRQQLIDPSPSALVSAIRGEVAQLRAQER